MIKIRLITAVWCPSCLIMRPRYQALVMKHPQFVFEELDFDTDGKTVESLSIGKTLPVAIIDSDDQEFLRIVGEKSPHEIERLVNPLL